MVVALPRTMALASFMVTAPAPTEVVAAPVLPPSEETTNVPASTKVFPV